MTFLDGLMRLSNRLATFGENRLRFCWIAGLAAPNSAESHDFR